MRPRLLFVTGALLVAALFLAGRAAAANPQTAGLQVALRAYGLYTGQIDAIAGPETATATRIFQQRHGLFPDGLAGRKTRAAMGVLGRPLFGRRQTASQGRARSPCSPAGGRFRSTSRSARWHSSRRR